MTEQERYLFDLQGYLVVPSALSREQVAALNVILDQRLVAGVPPTVNTHRFEHLLRWGGPYLDLIDNPRISPYLEELLGEGFRLDHDYADVIRSGKGPIGTTLHGGATPFESPFYYRYDNGRMRNGLLVVAYNLMDVDPGDGGFAAVPGSHKSNLPFPADWRELEHQQPFVQPVTGPAGTAILFTEALTHGTLPWRGAQERRTLFYKYSPCALSWAATYYRADDYPDLTRRQRAILEPPNARYPGRWSRPVIPPDDLNLASQIAKEQDRKLGDILVEQFNVSPFHVLQAEAHQAGMRAVDLTKHAPDPEALKRVPPELARRHRALPITVVDGTLVIAIGRPDFPIEALDELRMAAGCKIQPVLVQAGQLAEAIDRLYPLSETE